MAIKVAQLLSASVFTIGFSLMANESFAQCMATTTANAGVGVTVTATLHTSDPNENGEGEPLQIRSSDGRLNASVPSYEIPYTFSFTSGQPNVSVSGTIAGFDGDESCELGVSTRRFSQATKDSLTKIAAGLGTVSGALWTYDALCSAGVITAVACNATIGIGAASTSLLTGLAASLLAIDPVDPNYTQLPIAASATFTPIVAGVNITPQQASAMNALLTNETAIMGYMRAMIQAINRASTAEAAGDVIWPARQLQALASFQLSLGNLLNAEAGLRQTYVNAMLAAGAGPVSINAGQAFQTEAQIASGWSARQRQLLQTFGVSSDIIELARRIAYVQNIDDIAGAYPNKLAQPSLLDALRSAATAARGMNVSIKPGSDPAPINVLSNGVTPVAVLGSAAFDVQSLDLLSARFGPNAISQSFAASFADVNGDGVLDVVFQFRTDASGIKCGDTSAVLTAKTKDGNPLAGSGAIKTVSCK
jgi:hypothetical protein